MTSLGDSIYLLGNRQWQFGRTSRENEVYDKVSAVCVTRGSTKSEVSAKLSVLDKSVPHYPSIIDPRV